MMLNVLPGRIRRAHETEQLDVRGREREKVPDKNKSKTIWATKKKISVFLKQKINEKYWKGRERKWAEEEESKVSRDTAEGENK